MRQERVLVIDDEPAITRLLEMTLIHEGYAVVTATRGEQAIAQFEAHAPDAVLLDLNLPGMSGVEVYQQLRAHSEVPILIVTGNVVLEGIVRNVLRGNDSVLLKPFDLSELIQRVAALFRPIQID